MGLFWLMWGAVLAQTDPRLQDALTYFNRGQINLALDSLTDANISTMGKDQVNAYRLKVLCLLFLNQQTEAEQAMSKLLGKEPSFEPSESDSPEFKAFWALFRREPIVRFGVRGGANYSQINVLKRFSVGNEADANETYEGAVGWQVALTSDIRLPIPLLALGVEVGAAGTSYDYTERDLVGFATTTFTEEQIHLNIPVFLRFNLPLHSAYEPYLQVGGTYNYLLQSQLGQVRREDLLSGDTGGQRIVTPTNDISLKDQRQLSTPSLMLGAGFKLDQFNSKFAILVDARVNIGMTNRVVEAKRAANLEMLYDYGYIDNDLKINTFELSVGFLYNQYQHKIPNRTKRRLNMAR